MVVGSSECYTGSHKFSGLLASGLAEGLGKGPMMEYKPDEYMSR